MSLCSLSKENLNGGVTQNKYDGKLRSIADLKRFSSILDALMRVVNLGSERAGRSIGAKREGLLACCFQIQRHLYYVVLKFFRNEL